MRGRDPCAEGTAFAGARSWSRRSGTVVDGICLEHVRCRSVRRVTFDDWLLALHVLSAFRPRFPRLVLFWILIVATASSTSPGRRSRSDESQIVGSATVTVGTLGTIVFLLGVWFRAIALDAYQVWDGSVIAAMMLWAIAAAAAAEEGRSSPVPSIVRASSRPPARPAPTASFFGAEPHVGGTAPPHDLQRRNALADPARHRSEARGMSVLAAIRPAARTSAARARARGDDPRRRCPHRRYRARRRAGNGFACCGSATGRCSPWGSRGTS